MRCGDWLSPRPGHVLLRLPWFNRFGRAALGDLDRVVIISNRQTHVSAPWQPRTCNALVGGVRDHLQHLLGPRTVVEVAEEAKILVDLHCAVSASVLVVATWGSSFGHWAAMLGRACVIVLPTLLGLEGHAIAAKHGDPIGWRRGLYYVPAARDDWVRVADYPPSVWSVPERALALLRANRSK